MKRLHFNSFLHFFQKLMSCSNTKGVKRCQVIQALVILVLVEIKAGEMYRLVEMDFKVSRLFWQLYYFQFIFFYFTFNTEFVQSYHSIGESLLFSICKKNYSLVLFDQSFWHFTTMNLTLAQNKGSDWFLGILSLLLPSKWPKLDKNVDLLWSYLVTTTLYLYIYDYVFFANHKVCIHRNRFVYDSM